MYFCNNINFSSYGDGAFQMRKGRTHWNWKVLFLLLTRNLKLYLMSYQSYFEECQIRLFIYNVSETNRFIKTASKKWKLLPSKIHPSSFITGREVFGQLKTDSSIVLSYAGSKLVLYNIHYFKRIKYFNDLNRQCAIWRNHVVLLFVHIWLLSTYSINIISCTNFALYSFQVTKGLNIFQLCYFLRFLTDHDMETFTGGISIITSWTFFSQRTH